MKQMFCSSNLENKYESWLALKSHHIMDSICLLKRICGQLRTFVFEMRVGHQFVHNHIHVLQILWAKILPFGFILEEHWRRETFKKKLFKPG